MLARYGDVITRRKFVDQLDIGHQPGAREDALQKVVAEQSIFWNPPRERGFEEVHIVNAFAAIRALTEKILIEVRNRAGVRVDAPRVGEDTLKQRFIAIHRQ